RPISAETTAQNTQQLPDKPANDQLPSSSTEASALLPFGALPPYRLLSSSISARSLSGLIKSCASAGTTTPNRERRTTTRSVTLSFTNENRIGCAVPPSMYSFVMP